MKKMLGVTAVAIMMLAFEAPVAGQIMGPDEMSTQSDEQDRIGGYTMYCPAGTRGYGYLVRDVAHCDPRGAGTPRQQQKKKKKR